MIDRHQQAVRFDELGENVLQDVLGIARVADAPPDEVAQTDLFPLEDFGDPPVLVAHLLQPGRVLHPEV